MAKSSYDYWLERERQQRELYMLEEAEQEAEARRIYENMYAWTQKEIDAFYGKYATAEGIDITDAQKRVSQVDIKAYEELAKYYVNKASEYRSENGTNGGIAFSDKAMQEMRLYNATMKINRLELLKAQIGLHLVDGINDIDHYYEQVITDRTRKEIERQAGILGSTVTDADVTARAKNIVNASFYNATFSDRIWSNMDNLKSDISIELQKGLIAGVSSREMARRIKEHAFEKSFSDAHRLMVTELRRVQTDVAMDSYKSQNIDRYIFMAVNPRACPICRKIDGNDYAVKDYQPGLNAPPMHPRCHCCTAPYVDESEYEAWLSWLENGGSTAEWNKRKKGR